MAHELDINAGTASFVSSRTDAWHRLGITLPDAFTAEEAMEHGHLGGWDVRKVPMFAQVDTPLLGPINVEVTDRKVVVRDNPVIPDQVDVLGTVGNNYAIIQNEEHAEFLDTLVDESGAHFETAGALKGGSQVFITMKLPGHINVGGVDPVENYLAAINSHDGSMAFTIMVTPVRIVCKNTMNLAFANQSNIVRIRHSAGAHGSISRAREALEMSFNYLDGFQEEAERLINTPMSSAAFEEIIRIEFGAGDDATVNASTRADTKIEELLALFDESETHAEVRNTAWAGLNAMTEWYDHFSPTRGDAREDSRAQNAVFNPKFKNRARDLILAHV